MTATTDPQQQLTHALASVNTPEHAGRVLVSSVLTRALKQQRANGNAKGPIKVPLTATLTIGDPFGPGGPGGTGIVLGDDCVVIHAGGVTVIFCPEE
jgi:hypothetical protein